MKIQVILMMFDYFFIIYYALFYLCFLIYSSTQPSKVGFHFAENETKAQRGKETCSRAHS